MKVSAEDPLHLPYTRRDVSWTMIQSEVNVDSWIIGEHYVMPRPGKAGSRIRRMRDVEVDVIAVGIQIVARREHTTDVPGVVHVEALRAEAIRVRLVNQFHIGSCSPPNAVHASIAREPMHR